MTCSVLDFAALLKMRKKKITEYYILETPFLS